ncbi:MAG: cbb3-type cytochrome c oxidase subunit I [Gammaproteobacteria bacterium]|nr:cbb3-type cytochrome c oxidase subunit I [Gammaproteobacteria bacterium]NIR83830.1 cbb3-type cytochrome c oxidase subunit I [Gammaproteobacteria bacterium]NIV73437.1 cytochrome C oxidase subunit I [Gammaproteobacteria bacterium]
MSVPLRGGTALGDGREEAASAAQAGRFALPVPAAVRAEARGWLWLGIAALVGSGVFALLILLSRTPYIQTHVPWLDFFHTALVVHVDLSVLVWFLAFAGVLWSLQGARGCRVCGWSALAVTGLGTVLLIVAPFVGEPQPLMSNYVPVLRQPVFEAGLVVVAAGFGLAVARALFLAPPVGVRISGAGALRFGLNTAVVAAAMALVAFVLSYLAIPAFAGGKEYYEILFWGGGHVLQFMYTQLMLVVWLWLADASGMRPLIGPRAVLFLFAWGLVSVFLTPLIYLAYDVGSLAHRQLFTLQMAFGGSLASLPLGLAVILGYAAAGPLPRVSRSERHALLWSVLLFGIGGVLGFMIQGSNVTVPAHYHGSVVGVTMAFMGMTYHLLPRLGYRPVAGRLAVTQAWTYGVGQLLHVAGLAWSGLEGVQRKTAGAAQGLDSPERILAMGVMGLGGLLAVVGGLLFLVVVLRAMGTGPSRGIPAVDD